MRKIMLFSALALALARSVLAADMPTAGGQMQQIPPVPVQQKAITEVKVEKSPTQVIQVPESARILVKTLRVTGSSVYSEAELLDVTGFRPWSELTLADLREMTAKIADHYHREGYFVAQVYLPAQEIVDGVVTIAVLEGRYGNIVVNNSSDLSDNLVSGYLSGLKSGQLIVYKPLERRLLLLSDLNGVEIESTLVPGVTPGTSDLIIAITPGRRISGSVDADNAGNRYTGKYRIGATVNLNNPAGLGDVAQLRVLTSGYGLYYVRGSYQINTASKITIGIAYSVLGYRLGEEFKPLKANGTAQIISLYGSYPLVRTRNDNHYFQLSFDDKTFQDRVDTTSTITDKTARVLTFKLYGDHRDNFGGGGLSVYALTWTTGTINILTPSAYYYDAVTAESNGPYNKFGFSGMRLQHVTDYLSLYGAFNGQFALKNLDASEKMGLGGMYAVRAYPEGEGYSDQGFVLNLEARLLLSGDSVRKPGQLHLVGFFDTGTVTINKDPWTDENNHRTLSGAGVGLTWEDYDNFSAKAYYAWKIGNDKATSAPDEPGQFWFQLVKYF